MTVRASILMTVTGSNQCQSCHLISWALYSPLHLFCTPHKHQLHSRLSNCTWPSPHTAFLSLMPIPQRYNSSSFQLVIGSFFHMILNTTCTSIGNSRKSFVTSRILFQVQCSHVAKHAMKRMC